MPTTGKCVGPSSDVAEPSKAASQDVDLRLVASPSKKRASVEREDVEPPLKKSKAAVMDL